MSALSKFFFGSPTKFEQLPTVTPEQKSILDQVLGGIGGPLGSGMQNLQQILSGRPEAFEAFQAPARTAFMQQTVPGIAERFTGADAQASSAFGQTLGAAAAGLEENLAAQRAGLQAQALGQLQQLLGLGMTPQFTTQGIPGQPGALQGLMGGIGTGIGGLGMMGLGKGFQNLLSGLGFFGGPRSFQTGRGQVRTNI